MNISASQLKPCFNNAVINEPKPGKPHIVFIRGFWRVSKCNKKAIALYVKAHSFVSKKNGS